MMLTKLRRARADIATMNRLFPAAERIAHAEGAERPGAEHLLLAALELEDTSAHDVLGEVGVDAAALKAAISSQHAQVLASIGIDADDAAIDAAFPDAHDPRGVYRSEGSLQAVFQRAVALAKEDKSELLSAHILLAATEPEHCTVSRALDHLGVDRRQLHELTRRRLDKPSD